MTTLADLKAILDEYGDRPEIVHGVAVAARCVWAIDATGHTDRSRKVEFLLGLLNDVFYDLSQGGGGYYEKVLFDNIYIEIVGQLLGDLKDRLYDMTDGNAVPLRGLIAFLGKHEPLDGLRGKIREFLKEVATQCMAATLSGMEEHYPPAIMVLFREGWYFIAKALLRYQMFSELGMLVDRRIYEIMPALFQAVIDQKGASRVATTHDVEQVACYGRGCGRDTPHSVARVFEAVGGDARTLYLLLKLANAYNDEHREPYPGSKLYSQAD